MIPCRKSPCKNCPFRKDVLKGWLGKERIENILSEESFVCHKNNDLQCAGHMLLLKEANVFYRTLKVLAPDFKIEGLELIFESKKDCIDHHTF